MKQILETKPVTDLKKQWDKLSERDQKFGMIGGFVLIVMLIYFLMINPLSDGVKDLKKSVADSQQLLSWMSQASEQVKQSQMPSANTFKNQSLLSLIENSTKTSKLAQSVSEIKQLDNDKVQLKFKTVSFDQLVPWLKNIQNKYGVYISKISLRRTEATGIIQADVVVSRS